MIGTIIGAIIVGAISARLQAGSAQARPASEALA